MLLCCKTASLSTLSPREGNQHQYISDLQVSVLCLLELKLTCSSRLGIRHVIPKPTNSRFVRMKARMALVTFCVFLSLLFFCSPLQKRGEVKMHQGSHLGIKAT